MRKKLKNALMPHKGNGHVPHLLSTRAALAGVALVLIMELAIFAGPTLVRKTGFDIAAVLPSIVTLLTNEVRAESSLPALTQSEVLSRAAQAKANDMAEKGYFAHQSPDGTQPWDWISREGYTFQHAGENLAVNFEDSEEVVEAWQKSPTHNLNLLGPRYTEIGVAVAEGRYKGRKATFIVQMFAAPVASPQPFAQTPAQQAAQLASAPASVAEDTFEIPVLGSAIELPAPTDVAERVVTSPRTYGTYALGLFAGLLLAVIVAGWGRHHSRALANGALAVAVVAGVIFVNDHYIFEELEVPVDSEYAATALRGLKASQIDAETL